MKTLLIVVLCYLLYITIALHYLFLCFLLGEIVGAGIPPNAKTAALETSLLLVVDIVILLVFGWPVRRSCQRYKRYLQRERAARQKNKC